MTYVDSGTSLSGASAAANDLVNTLDQVQSKADKLTLNVGSFAGAMTRAFGQAVSGGKQFDDVLKSLALKLSDLAVKGAFNSVAGGVFGGSGQISLNAMGAIKPFATGGVIGAPTYFPLSNGGLGLAGEAGPEAIVPLTRGGDGRLGVAMNGQAAPSVTVQIMAPDVQSFHRSEAYLTGQIARAVARGQRSL